MIKATVKVDDISQNITKELSGVINQRINGMLLNNDLKNFIKDEIAERIRNTPHYQSLISGELNVEFGLLNAQSQLENIINVLSSEVDINFNPLDDNMNGSIEVVIPLDRVGLEGFYTSIGGPVPWLDWLLSAGSSIVIADYKIVRGDFASSRSGAALMVPGEGYHVPVEYAGVAGDNFITQALEGIEEMILGRIENVLS